MYVLPFWSYRPAAGGYLVRHYLTGQELAVPSAMLDLLEAIHTGVVDPPIDGVVDPPIAGAGGDSAGGLVRLAVTAKIAFPDRAAADRWLSSLDERTTAELPVIDQIEMTNRCPYTCTMCPRTTSMDRPLGEMSLDLLGGIIGQVRDRMDFVALHHFGESLLHRQLPEAVALARELGVRTGLSCNPPSLRPALGERLLRAGITNVLFSLDSLNAETYRAIRGPVARIDLADRNLREFVRMRDAGGYDTSITLQMISMRVNEDEAAEFIRYCQDVGVDRGLVIRLGRWDFTDEYVAGLGEITAPGYTAPCSLPWHSVAVLWDGRVVPCCHDYNAAVVLGDLSRQSLAEVWHSDAATTFRAECDSSELCTRCSASKPWREQQREREGFRAFHRERLGDGEVRQEWINEVSAGWRDGRRWFDRYDIVPVATAARLEKT